VWCIILLISSSSFAVNTGNRLDRLTVLTYSKDRLLCRQTAFSRECATANEGLSEVANHFFRTWYTFSTIQQVLKNDFSLLFFA
jgi:hypothetical protein